MTTRLTAQQVKEKLLNRKRRMQKLTISLPDLEELDDQLAIQELMAKDVEDAQSLSKDRNDETNESVALGVLIARSLVLYDNKERIFNDIEGCSLSETLGMLLLLPLGEAVKQFSGINPEALEIIRKNLNKIPGSDSVISSEEK